MNKVPSFATTIAQAKADGWKEPTKQEHWYAAAMYTVATGYTPRPANYTVDGPRDCDCGARRGATCLCDRRYDAMEKLGIWR